MSNQNFNYQVGGSLPADAPSYVDRQCDRDYYELLKERKYCYVFNCRQMGKSSLRVRVTHKLQAEGVVCATIDPQKIGVEVSCEQWYASAIRSLVGDLDLKSKFDLRSWIRERELLSPVQRFAEFIETVVLQEIDTPIVIFVEEIDRLLSLKFGMDDFFGLVRSFFEDRPTKPEYNRLTFSFLGVATPTDLIQSNNTSAFNIGYAVEMAGFTLTEALPLMEGLANRVTNPQDYLAEAVQWTGGQPFLIQRLLGIIRQELAEIAPPENVALWVENLVQERVVTNWESQDTPPHLTTIRDRVLSVEEKLRGRMLGCYQQVLADGELEDDRSEERSKLRLTGLVVRRDGRLVSYNPIYGAVFNNAWVEGQLADLRPEFYGSAFRAWQGSEIKDGFLLRGEALRNAEIWARGKRLSDVDEDFLRESREMEMVESNLKFEAERQARETAEERAIILDDAKQKADRRVKAGSAILAVTLALATGAGLWAARSVNEAKEEVRTTKKDTQDKLAKADLTVNSALKNAEYKAYQLRNKAEKDAVARKREADRNVEEAKENLESAKSELANVSQLSEEKVAVAQAEIAKSKNEVNKAIQSAKLVEEKSLAKEKTVKSAIKSTLAALIDLKRLNIDGFNENTLDNIVNGDISKLNELISAKGATECSWEGRSDLGNTQIGDGKRFKGRGYIQITGRSAYKRFGEKINVNLVNNPEKASDPRIAAKTLIVYMNEIEVKKYIDEDNLYKARLIINYGYNGIDSVNSYYNQYLGIYQKILETGEPELKVFNEMKGTIDPDWLRIHVPAILLAMKENNITDIKYKAYILATATHETGEGKYITEISCP